MSTGSFLKNWNMIFICYLIGIIFGLKTKEFKLIWSSIGSIAGKVLDIVHKWLALGFVQPINQALSLATRSLSETERRKSTGRQNKTRCRPQ